jgi:hypothetical protein
MMDEGEGGTDNSTLDKLRKRWRAKKEKRNGSDYCSRHPRECSNPNKGRFTTSFQMFYTSTEFTYSQAAEEGFTDFPGGGSPNYLPQIYGVNNNTVTTPGAVNAGNALTVINDGLRGYAPIYERNHAPYDQQVALTYDTTWQDIPSANATGNVTLNSMEIHNGSNIGSVINYTVSVTSVDHTVVSHTSAAPGQTVDVPLPSGLNISVGGLNIAIAADTGCRSVCWSNPGAPNFFGNLRFNFNP